MDGVYSVEELVIDDSFKRFCFNENEADTLHWKKYIQDYPDEIENIEMARQLILGISLMLKQEYASPELSEITVQESLEPVPAAPSRVKKMLRYAVAVAAVFATIFVGWQVIKVLNDQPRPLTNSVAIAKEAGGNQFKTANGEKKLFILPDSTKLWLNAGSELRLDEGFGKNNRQVFLVGEALFDVTHNKALPFIVHIDKYDIKVLGTLFNVKAYPGDKLSETSLLRGKVEIQMADNSRKIQLVPNQKLVINNLENSPSSVVENGKSYDSAVVLLPLTLSARDNAIIETSWSKNRLEIVDESFADMKEKLERWFNVKLIFKDDAVSNYRFSATFEGESIQQVLNALENAYQFKHEINGNEIIVSK